MLNNFKIKEMKIAVKKIGLDIKTEKNALLLMSQKRENVSAVQSGLFYLRKNARHIYLAYGIARGKEISQIERNPKTEASQKLIDLFLDQYRQEEII